MSDFLYFAVKYLKDDTINKHSKRLDIYLPLSLTFLTHGVVMTKYWLAIFTGLALNMAAQVPEDTANQEPAQNESSRRERSGRNSEAMRNMMEAFQKVDAQLKEKYPAEFAEIEKLNQSDRRAAFAKKRELAAKAGIEMPKFGRRRDSKTPEAKPEPDPAKEDKLAEWQKIEKQLKEKYPTEFAEYEKLRETDREAALAKLKVLAEKEKLTLPAYELPEHKILTRDLARLAVERAEFLIKRSYPDEYNAMVKLRAEDPDAAREKFRELAKKAGLDSEELKRQVIARPSSTRVIQVEKPSSNQTQTQNRNTYNDFGRMR